MRTIYKTRSTIIMGHAWGLTCVLPVLLRMRKFVCRCDTSTSRWRSDRNGTWSSCCHTTASGKWCNWIVCGSSLCEEMKLFFLRKVLSKNVLLAVFYFLWMKNRKIEKNNVLVRELAYVCKCVFVCESERSLTLENLPMKFPGTITSERFSTLIANCLNLLKKKKKILKCFNSTKGLTEMTSHMY